MAEETTEKTFTLDEIVRQQHELEEEAEYQLSQNWGTENSCTFSSGKYLL
jgi:hypothetical protein